MQILLIWMARIAAIGGVALIAVAAVARLSGMYSLGGFYTGTILQAGMAGVLLACLGYLATLVERGKS